MAYAPRRDRDRAIFIAFEGGRTQEQLALDYALTPARIRAILADERLRRVNSPDPFYKTIRQSKDCILDGDN